MSGAQQAMQQAAQAMQQAAQAMAGTGRIPDDAALMAPMNPGLMADAYEHAAAAAMTPVASSAAVQAMASANAMASVMSEVAVSMGMLSPQAISRSGPPGGPSGSAPGVLQPSSGGSGGGFQGRVRGDSFSDRAELGGWFGRWSRPSGDVDSRVADPVMENVKPDYRDLVKQYFEEVSRRGTQRD
jgi:hypothetical protein